MTTGFDLLPIVNSLPAAEGTKPLRGAIANSLAEVWQGIVGDKVAAWRLQNAAGLSKTLNEKLVSKGLKLDREKLSDRYAFTWFEEATKQDEPELQELFARLLLNAANGDKDALDRRHLTTLSQFTPTDAKVFERLYNPLPKFARPSFGPRLPRWPHESTVWTTVQEFGEAAGTSIEHLINLGVFARGFEIETQSSRRHLGGEPPIAKLKIKNEIIATGLGWSLHLALASNDEEL